MTNEPLASTEIVACSHGRSEAENRNKELKNGTGAGRPPSATLVANLIRVWLCALTYNVYVTLAERLFPGQRRQEQTMRWRRLQMAGLTRRAGD